MEIELKITDAKGKAVATENGQKLGEMTFSVAGSDTLIIDHTEVDSAYQGKGVGKELLLRIVDMARTEKKSIIPLCPFANAMFKRVESIRDVLK